MAESDAPLLLLADCKNRVAVAAGSVLCVLLQTGRCVLVDDVPAVREILRHYRFYESRGYVAAPACIAGKNTTVRLARIVAALADIDSGQSPLGDGAILLHANHDGLDCRAANLVRAPRGTARLARSGCRQHRPHTRPNRRRRHETVY